MKSDNQIYDDQKSTLLTMSKNLKKGNSNTGKASNTKAKSKNTKTTAKDKGKKPFINKSKKKSFKRVNLTDFSIDKMLLGELDTATSDDGETYNKIEIFYENMETGLDLLFSDKDKGDNEGIETTGIVFKFKKHSIGIIYDGKCHKKELLYKILKDMCAKCDDHLKKITGNRKLNVEDIVHFTKKPGTQTLDTSKPEVSYFALNEFEGNETTFFMPTKEEKIIKWDKLMGGKIFHIPLVRFSHVSITTLGNFVIKRFLSSIVFDRIKPTEGNNRQRDIIDDLVNKNPDIINKLNKAMYTLDVEEVPIEPERENAPSKGTKDVVGKPSTNAIVKSKKESKSESEEEASDEKENDLMDNDKPDEEDEEEQENEEEEASEDNDEEKDTEEQEEDEEPSPPVKPKKFINSKAPAAKTKKSNNE